MSDKEMLQQSESNIEQIRVILRLQRLSKSDGIGPHSHIFGWAPAEKSAERQSES
jgi:hypothetical protein